MQGCNMKILTIDIGGTNIKYAYMLEDTSIVSRDTIATPQKSRGELIGVLTKLFEQEAGVQGIAISMPGIIDTDKGYCAMGGALRYNDDFYLRHALFRNCPVRIVIQNDAKCAAMAESRVGSLQDVSDGFVIILGTMIGGGFIVNHHLHKGRHFSAGEVSYIMTSPEVPPTKDGVWGNQCSATGLCSHYAQIKGLDPDSIDGLAFFKAVDDGDETALQCLDKFAHDVAVQIYNIQNICDPQRFAIGGGISAQPTLIESIRSNLDKLYATCPYHVSRAEVTACKFQNDANLVGALQCYLEDANESEYFGKAPRMDEDGEMVQEAEPALVNDFGGAQ